MFQKHVSGSCRKRQYQLQTIKIILTLGPLLLLLGELFYLTVSKRVNWLVFSIYDRFSLLCYNCQNH